MITPKCKLPPNVHYPQVASLHWSLSSINQFQPPNNTESPKFPIDKHNLTIIHMEKNSPRWMKTHTEVVNLAAPQQNNQFAVRMIRSNRAQLVTNKHRLPTKLLNWKIKSWQWKKKKVTQTWNQEEEYDESVSGLWKKVEVLQKGAESIERV